MLQQFLGELDSLKRQKNQRIRQSIFEKESTDNFSRFSTRESESSIKDIKVQYLYSPQKFKRDANSLQKCIKDQAQPDIKPLVSKYLLNLKTSKQNQDFLQQRQLHLNSDRQNKDFDYQQSVSSIKTLINDFHKLNNSKEKNTKNPQKEILSRDKQILSAAQINQIYSLNQIRGNIIGINTKYQSVYGTQLEALYVDHTATNRPFNQIEQIVAMAKAKAANPHTQYSHYGQFSTFLMEYSNKSILNSLQASESKYVALPAGSGATGAIQKLFKILSMNFSKKENKPIVFVTKYQHHSNILPWVQYYDDVRVLPCNQQGILNIPECFKALEKCQNKKILMSISAASNITSHSTNLKSLNNIVARLRPQKEVVFCVDLAAYCVHHQMNLSVLNQIDFCALSPHKNLGGVESCGVLIARKCLIEFEKPTFPGGGTVLFVKGFKKQDIKYSGDVFERQISGTPPFLGFYRAALSFQLLRCIGYDNIHRKQRLLTDHFVEKIKNANSILKNQKYSTRIQLYGDQNFQNRANVVIFNILDSQDSIVNFNLVSLLLTDLYGIQLRSGCFCAGPFGALLLKINQNIIDQIVHQINNGDFRKKPGFLRLDLAFYLKPFQVDYLVEAILNIAKYWKNMQQFYNLEQNGKVTRKLAKQHNLIQQYSLYKLREKAWISNLENQFENKMTQLKNRQSNLKRQLAQANKMIQDPLKTLSKRNFNNMKTIY